MPSGESVRNGEGSAAIAGKRWAVPSFEVGDVRRVGRFGPRTKLDAHLIPRRLSTLPLSRMRTPLGFDCT